MDSKEVKEGIAYLLWRTQGSTFEEILDFLGMNNVSGFEGDAGTESLRKLLEEMKDEGLVEERFMVDGTDRADFALEGGGIEIFGSGERTPILDKKWKTNKPSLQDFQHEGEGMQMPDSE
jgi:hypothetical protein